MSNSTKGAERFDRKGGERSGHLNIRFSDTGRYIMDLLQEYYGLSQSSIIEMLLREEARRKGMVIPGSGQDREQQRQELAERIRKQNT